VRKGFPDREAVANRERGGFWYDRLCEKNHKVTRLVMPESSFRIPIRGHDLDGCRIGLMRFGTAGRDIGSFD